MVALGAFFAPKFLKSCDSKITPPSSTQGHEADEKASRWFPSFSSSKSMAVYVTLKNPNSPNSSLVDETHKPLLQKLETDFCSDAAKRFKESKRLISCSGYTTICKLLPLTSTQLISPPKCANDCAQVKGESMCSSSVIALTMTSDWDNGDTKDTVDILKSHADDSLFDATLTGNEVFYYEGEHMIAETLHTMDTVSLPLAVLVVWITLGNIRMLLILGFNILICLTLAFTIMYPIAQSTTVYTTVPSMMMSVIIAMSIDYSLFLLARFQEEVRKEKCALRKANVDTSRVFADEVRLWRIIFTMLDHAGYNVFVSGTCLMLCFIGLLCFPVSLIFSLGAGAAVAVSSAILVNLSMSPVLLYVVFER